MAPLPSNVAGDGSAAHTTRAPRPAADASAWGEDEDEGSEDEGGEDEGGKGAEDSEEERERLD